MLKYNYARLQSDLEAAAEAATKAAAETAPGGSGNRDDAWLWLPRANRKKVEAAGEAAGLPCSWVRSGKYLLCLPAPQLYDQRNTAAVVAAAAALRARGYDATVTYDMD